jgi:hypothetical protein
MAFEHSQHLKTGVSGFIISISVRSRAFEILTNGSGFWMVTSLDRFIEKRIIKNILFMPKQSRLAENFRSGFQMVETKWRPSIRKMDRNCVQKMTIRKSDRPDFRCWLYWTNCLVLNGQLALPMYVLWSENQSSFWMVKNKMANFTIWKPDTDCVQKMNIWMHDCPVFRWWL